MHAYRPILVPSTEIRETMRMKTQCFSWYHLQGQRILHVCNLLQKMKGLF